MVATVPGMPPIPHDQRLVTLVLCDASGALLGSLAPFLVAPRFWPEVGAVVEHVRDRDGIEVAVLRLLTTSGGYAGGAVTYLAQLVAGVPAQALEPVPPAAADAAAADPAYRQWWAEPDALATLPAWVDAGLAAHGRRRTGPLRQRKTWNLSLLLSAPTDSGDVWVKATPPFLADEAGVMARVHAVDPLLAPTVLAHDPGRRLVLMDHVAGEDQFGLDDVDVLTAMATRLVDVQHALVGDVGHLLAVGAAHLRAPALLAAVEGVVQRAEVVASLSVAERRALEALVTDLPRRLAEAQACGLPDTLVHNDAHPGNWRWDRSQLTLLDWADVGVGNPALDLRAFTDGLPTAALSTAGRSSWQSRWSFLVPGSDPARAAEMLEPVAQLRAAATYQRFLDHIEATERVYHDHDPVDRFRAAIA